MRKTLFALLGLVAIGIGAVPALAGVAGPGDPPPMREPIALENRAGAIGTWAKNGNNYQATLSGTLIKQASNTTSWFLYPGAAADRSNGPAGTLGTWAPKSTRQADSLNTYPIGSQGGYGRADLSLAEKLFKIVDSGVTPPGQRPLIPTGTRALWCGKYDPNWVVQVGYPNITNQILYIDLESNRTPITYPAEVLPYVAKPRYTITAKVNMSLEQNYDFMYFIGGGDSDHNLFGDEDPLRNNRARIDAIRASGSDGEATLQAQFTGSLQTLTTGLAPFVNGAEEGADIFAPVIIGDGASPPNTIDLDFRMTVNNRALYILVTADCLFSSEDGLWAYGNGVVIDDLTVNDGAVTRVLYDENLRNAPLDGQGNPILEGNDIFGDILIYDGVTATDSDGVRISSRVFPGVGELWSIQAGNNYATGSDVCALQKSFSTDRFFLGVEASTSKALKSQFNAVVTPTFPVMAGTADILAVWGEYLNLPRSSGYVQYAEYRQWTGGISGTWSNWNSTSAGGGVVSSVIDTWAVDGDQLANAVQADSFQVRYVIQCIPGFSADRVNCDANTTYAVLYDDLFIQVTTGVPAPVFGIFPGSIAQSTFVDGTMTGVNCTVTPCWPGIRGSDLVTTGTTSDIRNGAMLDNMNSPNGDSLTMGFVTGLRKNGMGINWQYAYDKSVGGGDIALARTNGSFNPALDTPRAIYRLYDPFTTTWSPWDSTALDADGVSVAGDTVVINSRYRLNWPPRDKVGANLPGGFQINEVSAYNNLAFLPRGTRMQYYFKAVDIVGGVAYQFSTDALPREVEDLPTLPNSANIAPDIIEFNVLPRVYPAGAVGSLVGSNRNTPVLNLDGTYGGWPFGQDPVTAALRGMGVRADRYRLLGQVNSGHQIGGRELTGDRPGRLSNHFPNLEEYGIVDSLRSWYRIAIQSQGASTNSTLDEAASQLMNNWASTPTNSNDGDRCIFLSGDDAFNSMTNQAVGIPGARRQALAANIFGVSNVQTLVPGGPKGAWAGFVTTSYPTIDDRFAAQASGPGLALAGSFTYEVDGGCPGPNRFDPLTPTQGGVGSATFPLAGPVANQVTDIAAMMKVSEFDTPIDNDRVKSLGYGFSIAYVRGAPGAIPRTAANYVRSGVQNRMQILYKFLTGCRGARGSGDICWPCPTDANMMSNWQTATGFNTALYGPLYPIQDFTKATGIGVEEASAAPRANRLLGNSPNPFNPLTKISFSAATAGKVTIRIFNVAGQLVRTLETKVDKAGPASVYWDGKSDRSVSSGSGVYFYKATFANGATLASDKNMVLVK